MLQKKSVEKLQGLLRYLKNNSVLNQLVYENIYLTGSAPAKIYGLPNMHKFTPSNLFS